MTETIRWRGLRFHVAHSRKAGTRYSLDNRTWYPSPKAAVRMQAQRQRTIWQAPGVLLARGGLRGSRLWTLNCTQVDCFETGPLHFDRQPTLAERFAYLERARARLPDPDAPSELGWRAWDWDATYRGICSPHQRTPWPEAELRVSTWSKADSVRGYAGIHARRLPYNWRLAGWFADGHSEGPHAHPNLVHGIVERFGRFVLGTTGWRAEWVVIRELEAPNMRIAEGLRLAYPEVTVHLKED